MSLLAPIGLLGLLALGVLLLIYLLKPNYQNKYISSTFVWKLSLRYRKKRIPISKLRSILLLICQILFLIICALLLTRPYIPDETVVLSKNEKVLIIDASASMQAVYDGESRFDRAVDEAKEYALSALNSDGVVTVIVADNEPYIVFQQVKSDGAKGAEDKLDALKSSGDNVCSYGLANLDKAIELANDVVKQNPTTEVVLYTAKKYLNKGSVKVRDVSKAGEWNAAVLNAEAELVDNYYTFTIDVASYGNDIDLEIALTINDINGVVNDNVTLNTTVRCDLDKMRTVTFNTRDSGHNVYSFTGAHVSLRNVTDNFAVDNEFSIYGGSKPVVKVQYASSSNNNFFNGGLLSLKTTMRSKWDVQITEVNTKRDRAATSGYDFYVFEHEMPDNIPTDGVVILSDLDKEPKNANFGIEAIEYVPSNTTLTIGEEHDIMRGVDPGRITVASFREITKFRYVDQDGEPVGYVPLMYCAGRPVVVANNADGERVVVMSFSLNRSNAGVLIDIPLLIKNIFNFYFPATLDGGYVYEVNDMVSLNAIDGSLTMTEMRTGNTTLFDTLPSEVELKTYGDYKLTQYNYSGNLQEEHFFVHIPVSESDFVKERDRLPDIYVEDVTDTDDTDLLFYFAIALVVLLFSEWLLQIKENF